MSIINDESHYGTVNLDDVDEPTDAELDEIETEDIVGELLDDFDFDNFISIFDEFWNGSE